MTLHSPPRARISHLALVFFFGLMLASTAMAQTTHRVVHLWVDPVLGNDSMTTGAGFFNPNGQTECTVTVNEPVDLVDASQSSTSYLLHHPWPFKTITAAVAYLPALPYTSPVTGVRWERAVIHLLPGMYMTNFTPNRRYFPNHEQGNGETFPIRLPNNVSIQGTSALNTVLNLEGPVSGGTNPRGPAFEFGATAGTAGVNTFIDSVTILGAIRDDGVLGGFPERGSAIYLNPANPSEPTITNCFVVSNEIGVLIDAPAEIQSWHEPTIFNCTFAWNSIGIWNGQRSLPTTSVGISELIVVNCIFDATPPTSTNCPTYSSSQSDFQYLGLSDFEGLDRADMHISAPGPGNYNAFETLKFNTGAVVPGLVPTAVRSNAPVLATSRDIAPFTGGTSGTRRGILYIRDLLCNGGAIFGAFSTTVFDQSPLDFRLSPAVTLASATPVAPGSGSLNPLVDNGWYHTFVSTTMTMLGSTRSMTNPPGWFPLTTASSTWPFHSWDEDGEGFGNPRVRDHPVYANNGFSGYFGQDPPEHVPFIDIGADELGELIGIGYRMATTNLMKFLQNSGVNYPQMDNSHLWYLGPPTSLASSPPQKDKPMHRYSVPSFGILNHGTGNTWNFPPVWGVWDHVNLPAYYQASLADITPHLIPDVHPYWLGIFAIPSNPIWQACSQPTLYNPFLFQNPNAGVINPAGAMNGYASASQNFRYLDGFGVPSSGNGFWHLGRGPNPTLGGPINVPWTTPNAFNTFDAWCRANDTQGTPGVRETFKPTFVPPAESKPKALRITLEVEGRSTWTPSSGVVDPLRNSNIQSFLVVVEGTATQ